MTAAISMYSLLAPDLSNVGECWRPPLSAKGRGGTVHTYVCFIAWPAHAGSAGVAGPLAVAPDLFDGRVQESTVCFTSQGGNSLNDGCS